MYLSTFLLVTLLCLCLCAGEPARQTLYCKQFFLHPSVYYLLVRCISVSNVENGVQAVCLLPSVCMSLCLKQQGRHCRQAFHTSSALYICVSETAKQTLSAGRPFHTPMSVPLYNRNSKAGRSVYTHLLSSMHHGT